MRLFVGIPLEPAIRSELVVCRQGLAAVPGVKVVNAENLHITLKFIGDIAEEQMPLAKDLFRQSVQPFKTCSLVLDGLGCFPHLRRPRVIWAGFKELSGTLEACSAALNAAFIELNIEPEERPFAGHITIGRIKNSSASRRAAALLESIRLKPLAQDVNRATLYQSVLHAQGAKFLALDEWEWNPAL